MATGMPMTGIACNGDTGITIATTGITISTGISGITITINSR